MNDNKVAIVTGGSGGIGRAVALRLAHGSIDLAIDKAVTARMFDKATSDLARLAQPGKPLFGIQESNAGKVVIFGGGIPIISSGNIIGAVGASAGTVEQDIAVAEAALAALVV